MAKHDLIEAFNDCVDRINAGEDIDRCLEDYQEYADYLRQLLETGQLVQRAQYPGAEVTDEQEAVRGRVVQAVRYKKREQTSRRRRLFGFVPMEMAAVLTLAVVAGLIVLTLIGPAIGNVYSNITNSLNGSGDYEEPSALATFSLLMTTTPVPGVAFEPTEMPIIVGATMMPTFAPLATGTPRPTDAGLSTAEAVRMTATSLAELIILTPDSGIVAGGPLPSALPETGGGHEMPVPTSVFLMSPIPGTPIAAVPSATPLPTMTLRPTTTVTSTGTPIPAAPTQGMPPTPTPIGLPQQVIPLSAGEIDDNARWDNYLLYRNNYLQQYRQSVHDVDVSNRQIISVMDDSGYPVLGAVVKVYAGQTLVSESRTYATGQTLFFPNARAESRGVQSFRVVIEKGNVSADFILDPQAGPHWNVTITNASGQQTTKLDVLFLLDSTGSMADEIMQLQNNILAISAQIDALPGNVDTHYGLVIYRDRGDVYVTRTYDFVPDVYTFQSSLNQVQAYDGGDTPESMNEALHEALNNVAWRGDDTVKLVFLVADAPPHLDYPGDYDYAQEMVTAAQKGVKIHPIASSGLDPSGEFIMRQIAQYTMGHFLFLTYQQGTAGVAGDSRTDLGVGEPSSPENQFQGDYTVEQLDELVLRLITDELAALRQRVQARSGEAIRLVLRAGSADRGSLDSALASIFGNDKTSGITLPFILVIVGLSALLGYLFRSQQAAPAGKRKNDERSVYHDAVEINNPSDDRSWPR